MTKAAWLSGSWSPGSEELRFRAKPIFLDTAYLYEINSIVTFFTNIIIFLILILVFHLVLYYF